jgi:uncharacterized protein YegP (UPF0339 family)
VTQQADRLPEAANDGGASSFPPLSEDTQKASPDSRYYFEICQVRPQNAIARLQNFEHWIWRLISPAGAALIECGGYSDQESCLAAVALLRKKASSAEISVAGS